MSTQHLSVSRGTGEGTPRGAAPSGEDTRGVGVLGESEDGQDGGVCVAGTRPLRRCP